MRNITTASAAPVVVTVPAHTLRAGQSVQVDEHRTGVVETVVTRNGMTRANIVLDDGRTVRCCWTGAVALA